MKKIGIAVLLILKLTHLSAQSDSAKLYQIEKWKLDKLLHSHFYVLPSCDTTVTKLQTALDSLKFALQTHEKYTEVIIQERDNKAAEAEARRLKEENKDQLHKAELKKEKVKGNKKAVAGFVVGVLIMLLL